MVYDRKRAIIFAPFVLFLADLGESSYGKRRSVVHDSPGNSTGGMVRMERLARQQVAARVVPACTNQHLLRCYACTEFAMHK